MEVSMPAWAGATEGAGRRRAWLWGGATEGAEFGVDTLQPGAQGTSSLGPGDLRCAG